MCLGGHKWKKSWSWMVPDGEKKGEISSFQLPAVHVQVCVNKKNSFKTSTQKERSGPNMNFTLQTSHLDSPGLMGKEKLPVHARSRCHSRSKSQVRHPNHRIPWEIGNSRCGEGQKKWNLKKMIPPKKKIHELLLFSSTKIYSYLFSGLPKTFWMSMIALIKSRHQSCKF